MVIDAHHHFWRYRPEEYTWIDEPKRAIARDFGPTELRAAMQAAGVDRVVSVQARQSLVETEWLLGLAETEDCIAGVVGWVPLASPTVGEDLARLSENPRLKALRHVVHDEPDDDFILGEAFNRGVALLSGYGFAYDLLIFERHLPQTIEFVDRHPDTRFVLDHIAKPRIAEDLMEPWRANLRALAERPNVCCKVSGLVTEADWLHWSPDELAPYLDAVLEAFGPKRLMFGSDWPVCLLACDYADWAGVVREWASRLGNDERERLFSGTAIEAYRLDAD